MSRRNNRSPKTVEQNTAASEAVIDNETREVVTEEGTVEMSAEDAAEIVAQGESAEAPAEAPAPEATDGGTEPQPEGDAPSEDSPAEQEVAVVVAPNDPFAALPLVTIEDYEFRDLTESASNSDPRKYEGVHREAVTAKLPVKKGWKHSADMITLGRVRKEFKPSSVYGTIAQIVGSYGRAGVPAYVLVAKLRQQQIGNKRSHYCTALPPVGWGEGWVDTFISKGFGKVMEKKAPALTQEVAQEIAEGDARAEAEAERIAA